MYVGAERGSAASSPGHSVRTTGRMVRSRVAGGEGVARVEDTGGGGGEGVIRGEGRRCGDKRSS